MKYGISEESGILTFLLGIRHLRLAIILNNFQLTHQPFETVYKICEPAGWCTFYGHCVSDATLKFPEKGWRNFLKTEICNNCVYLTINLVRLKFSDHGQGSTGVPGSLRSELAQITARWDLMRGCRRLMVRRYHRRQAVPPKPQAGGLRASNFTKIKILTLNNLQL